LGYFEADDLDAAAAHMAAQPVNTRWQDTMAPLLSERVPDAGRRHCSRSSGSTETGERRAPIGEDVAMRSYAYEHRRTLGFMSAQELERLGGAGILIPDPSSPLVSPRAHIGQGTVIYPTVIIDADAASAITIGRRCRLYPGVLLEARAGAQIVIADDVELGPGGVSIRVSASASAVLESEVRLSGGCELSGDCRLGRGAQLLGAISARSITLGGGLGGHSWPDPDGRGAVLKGTGLADGIVLERGEVRSCRPSFTEAPTERQSAHHPPATDQIRS
jgi:hypothetical protein